MSCVLISGEIGAGKSSVAKRLSLALGAELVSVRQALLDVLDLHVVDRRSLQESGRRLDRRTKGRWLVDYLASRLEGNESLIVDSLRTKRQTLPILERLPGSVLIYLDVTRDVRHHRFELSAREDPIKRSMSFDLASKHPTERSVVDLRDMATLVIEADGLTLEETVEEALSGTNLK